MTRVSVDDQHIKELVKQAVVEVFEERQDLLVGLLEEALEDLALASAIREGQSTAQVSKTDILRTLES